ncbi:MAG: hypothetical protein E4G91_11140 [Candidatus Zixiibacteriota bacterium]|nr:MAG: hypothetical protein E4G91_11140 [candidate division Zixibacteria bacterium]
MPYCPECLMEYIEGSEVCHDCQVRLLPGPPPEKTDKPDNPDDKVDAVLLLKGESVMQAKFLASALDDAKIPYVARGIGITDSLGGSAGGDVAFGAYSSPRGAEIYVNPSDLAAAQKVLDSISGNELSEGQDIDSDSGSSSSGPTQA